MKVIIRHCCEKEMSTDTEWIATQRKSRQLSKQVVLCLLR